MGGAAGSSPVDAGIPLHEGSPRREGPMGGAAGSIPVDEDMQLDDESARKKVLTYTNPHPVRSWVTSLMLSHSFSVRVWSCHTLVTDLLACYYISSIQWCANFWSFHASLTHRARVSICGTSTSLCVCVSERE